MVTTDILVQRLAAAIEQLEHDLFFDDDAAMRLFRDWLALYRAQRVHQQTHD